MRTCLLASLLLAAAACHPDGPTGRGDADFSAMTDEERTSAIRVAIGDPAGLPMYLFGTAELATGNDPACPSRRVSGDNVTYRAEACTNRLNVAYDGTLIGHNVPSYAGDPPIVVTQPMSIEMRDWLDDGAIVDGTLDRSMALPGDGALYTATATFTRDVEGVVTSYDVTADCTHRDDGEDCALEGFVELAAGSFELEGDYATAGTTHRGRITLRGANTLVVDFDAAPEDCVPVAIDGRDAGEYCN
jgi:hypothetical protein